jgi:hypothetical protein
MADLTYLDRMKLEQLYGMKSGYVLDFSDRTFEEFVRESTNKDIFGQQYKYNSGSKANRLRAFWNVEPNDIVGKLILDLCDYYTFKYSSKEASLLTDCVRIGNRLTNASASVPQRSDSSPSPARPVPAPALFDLLTQFDQMALSSDPQKRGYKLQDLLVATFSASGISVRKSFTRNAGAEQIDAAFLIDGWHYIVECRWRDRLSDIRQLDGLFGQVCRSGNQTMGLFLSIEGWSPNVPAVLKQNGQKRIILMDGYDLRCALDGQVSVRELLAAKLAHLNFDAEPYLSVATLILNKK